MRFFNEDHQVSDFLDRPDGQHGCLFHFELLEDISNGRDHAADRNFRGVRCTGDDGDIFRADERRAVHHGD